MNLFQQIKQKVLSFLLAFLVTNANAFGVDVCFNDPSFGGGIIQNCINIDESCRTDNLTYAQQITCRGNALISSLSGLSGSNAIIGGRSLVHSDSTYLMAQLIGFSAWQAYQIMIYDEATDQSEYTAFNQAGAQILSNSEIASCRENWGPNMPNECLILTPVLSGLYKFNYVTGGMLLHLHAQFSPSGNALPPVGYPIDYLSPQNIQNDPLLGNFQAWVFDRRTDACAAGITTPMSSITSPCAPATNILNSPQNFFAPGFTQLAVPFFTTLGPLIIDQNSTGNVYATDSSFQSYINPHDVAYAKMGIFLHTLGDRYSHHLCTDNSYFYAESGGNYNSNYSQVYCAQGSHFLWHGWEQGTTQTTDNLATQFQTMQPALSEVYDQLIAYAAYKGITINPSLNKTAILTNLITVLQEFDPQTRLNNMVSLTETTYGLLPLPGTGSAAAYSTDMWLRLAGAPVH